MEIAAVKKQLIDKKFAPIYVIQGTEDYLISEIKEMFLTKIMPEEDISLNVAQYDMTEVPLADAIEDAMSPPFFGDYRLVFIQSPFFLTGEKKNISIVHDLDLLMDYINNPMSSTILVILATYDKLDERKKVVKSLKTHTQFIEAKSMGEKSVRHFVAQTIENEGIQFSNEAFELLIQLTDANLSTIMGELPKLFLYGTNSKKITKENIEDLVPKSLEQNIFDLATYVLQKDVLAAETIYRDLLLQKEEPIKMNAILLSQFRLLLQVKILLAKGYSQGSITSALKVHPYRIKLAIQQAKKFSKSLLISAYDALIEAEFQMKTGKIAKNLPFELFLLKFSASK